MEPLPSDVLAALIEAVEALVRQRLATLQVGQNDLWLGLEPAEGEAILRHFSAGETPERFPEMACVSSASSEALRLRNRGRSAPRLLLVIDEPWRREAQDFRQSLQDLSRKDVLQLLATPVIFPAEHRWLERAANEEIRRWLEALFCVLRAQDPRSTIRDRDDLPMRISLSRYLTFLVKTPDESATVGPQAALGGGLWRLGLFSHETLFDRVAARRESPHDIAKRLAGPLTQNFRAAHDPDELAESLSSPQRTATEVLRRFRDAGYRLSVSEEKEVEAAAALDAFLSRIDLESALQLVEWEFYHRPSSQRAGRGRRGGLRALLAYRDTLADRREQIREKFLDRASPDRRDDLRRDIEPFISDLGRGAASERALGELERRARDLWADDPQELERVLSDMQRIHRKARRDPSSVPVGGILEGLVDVAVAERSNGAKLNRGTGTWRLSFPRYGEWLEVPGAKDDSAWAIFLESSHAVLRGVFGRRWEEIQYELDDPGELPDDVEIEIEIRTERDTYRYLLSEPRVWVSRESRILLGEPRLLVDSDEGDVVDLLATARAARLARSGLDVVCGDLRDLAQQLDPCGPFCIERIAGIVRSFGALLDEATAGRKAALIAERDSLREAARKARGAGASSEEVLSIFDRAERLDEQIKSIEEPEWTKQQAREVGRLQTILPRQAEDPGAAERGPERAWLMPLHPLILRARYVRDKIYLEAIRQLRDPEVDLNEVQVRLMDDFLDGVDLVSPCEVICPWSSGDRWPPLRFERYVGGFAEFATPATTQADYGRPAVIRAVRDYLALYGAARDRLVIYLESDPDGRAAYQFATALTAAGEEGESAARGIDLILLPTKNGRTAYLEDRAAARAGTDEALFGVARGALRPRVTFRRGDVPTVTSVEPAHVAVIYTGRDRLGSEPLLRGEPRWLPPPEARAELDPLSPSALFVPSRVDDTGAFLRVWTARDALDRRWEGLMALLHVDHAGAEFATEVNLAPEQNAFALRALHRSADWVILLSELPVHRAIEVARDTGARLIDRKRFRERGREYFLSVSTAHIQVLEGLLWRAVRETLGSEPGSTDGLLHFLRAFAPGLAMRYAGRPEAMGPSGILGLLLTARIAQSAAPGAFAVPLDEHPWLYGRGGLRADVLAVWSEGSSLALKVFEAKYLASVSEGELSRARQQVKRTSSVLEAWMTSPALEAYFRGRLHDALLPWTRDPITRDTAHKLFPMVLDMRVPLRIEHLPEVHIWLSGADGRVGETSVDGVRVVIHTLHETQEALANLCNARLSSAST